MIVIAADPGKTTGIVAYDSDTRRVLSYDLLLPWLKWPEREGAWLAARAVWTWATDWAHTHGADVVDIACVTEVVVANGSPFGRDTEATVRMESELQCSYGFSGITRSQVRKQLGTRRGATRDTAVRDALKRRFGEGAFDRELLCPKRVNKSHGDDCQTCSGTGIKREAGPLHGITRDCVAALAVAVAWAEMQGL